jgi:AmiR/NasT family two-component response regulator
MGATQDEELRVLIADEKQPRLDEIEAVVTQLGHRIVARPLDVSEIAEATERDRPDVAIVGLGQETEHALDLIGEIVKVAACPVIVDIDANDPAFIDDAARRGVFGYVRHGHPAELESALDIVLRRYAEFSRLKGALGRRAVIEQAKGILMERHGLSADAAFAELRDRARNTNQTLPDVADAVILSHPLFRERPPPEAA